MPEQNQYLEVQVKEIATYSKVFNHGNCGLQWIIVKIPVADNSRVSVINLEYIISTPL